jgi:Beta-lactamase class D
MKKTILLYAVILILSAGCARSEQPKVQTSDLPGTESVTKASTETVSSAGPETELTIEPSAVSGTESQAPSEEQTEKTTIIPTGDLAPYFQGFNGCAVFYVPSQSRYLLYNPDLCNTASSPCSTFKIVSSLIGLETGIIDQENSVYPWSGTAYWNKNWNRDIGFEDAFKVSCIWYFREAIDRAGKDTVQDFLNELEYGNCNISDWEGYQNTNNNIDALRGFWVESSLKISPLEQTKVMRAIFESDVYDPANITLLKQVMLTENENHDVKIYGKTGMGVADGLCVDAWFVGMAETNGTAIYFAIRLDDPQNEETSSTKAKEIAVDISDHFITNMINKNDLIQP